MLKNLIRRKRHPAPHTETHEVPAQEHVITRSFIIKMVLIVALAGPAIATLISPFVDQTIRNTVDDWMSIPDLFDSISIRPDEYARLPQYWRQALAEIALRPKEEAIDAQNIIEGLKVSDMNLVGLLAPYVTSVGILRDNSKLSEHPMPELSYNDFSHLQDLGILEDVNNGMKFDLTERLNRKTEISLPGTTVLLKFKAKNVKNPLVLEATAFTSGGKQLIEALRIPSNIAYFEWFAKNLEEKGFNVELFATGTRKNSVPEQRKIRGRIDRHSISVWPP